MVLTLWLDPDIMHERVIHVEQMQNYIVGVCVCLFLVTVAADSGCYRKRL